MKIPKQAYTLKFKQLALERVQSGQSVAGVARELGLIQQTLRNWVKAASNGELKDPKNGAFTPEQMELSRLKAELIRTQRELEIVKKAAAYFAKDAL